MQQVLRKCLFLALFLVIPVLLFGCGSGSSSSTPPPTLKVLDSGNGTYVIHGDNFANVGGIELTLTYDSATKSSPTVTEGDLVSGALPAFNTLVAGTVTIGLIRATPFSGSGTVATVTFATDTSPGGVTLSYSLIQ